MHKLNSTSLSPHGPSPSFAGKIIVVILILMLAGIVVSV
jgi:hypothetical protein